MKTRSKPPAALATHQVESATQIRALASTVRQELVDALQALGEASVPELAHQLGRPADALYYHLRALVRAGLVCRVGSRSQGRHVEAVYRTVAPDRALQLRYATGPGVDNGALKKLVGGMLRASGRAFERALADPDRVTCGPQRELWAGRIQGWLTPAGLLRANELLNQLSVLFAPGQRPPDGRLFALQILLAPEARGVSTSTTPKTRIARKPKT